MIRETAFACHRDGLRASLEGALLGGYDGAGAWSLHLSEMRNADEQEMVEHHEGLHHELQASSAWGLTSAMALLLARRGNRPHALYDVFDVMVDAARETHECFATVISATLQGVDRARELLADNPLYLGFLERSLRLCPPDHPWELRSAAIAATLRAVMAPAVILDVLELGFTALSPRALTVAVNAPDSRLSAFEAVGGPTSWTPVFDEIARARPGHAEGGTAERRAPLPDGPDALADLRRFEEEVVLPRCHQHVRKVLEDLGLPTLGHDQQSRMATMLKAAVSAVDPELGERLQLITERRPVLDDALEYDRQGVRLRDRLPVELLNPDETLAHLAAFTASVDDEVRYACAVWIDQRAARKQFTFPEGVVLPNVLVCLLVRARSPEGAEVVRIGLLPPGSTPRSTQDLLDVPLLVLTTHLTLTDAETLSVLQSVEPVFVLMDLPVAWHVDDWIAQGATVRFGLTPLVGNLSGELWMAAFQIDVTGGLMFLSIGGKIGVSVLIERLRQRHSDRFVVDGQVLQQHLSGVNLAVSHVAGTWHVLDQDGVE